MGVKNLAYEKFGYEKLGMKKLGIKKLGMKELGMKSLDMKKFGYEKLGMKSLGMKWSVKIDVDQTITFKIQVQHLQVDQSNWKKSWNFRFEFSNGV